MDEIELKNRFSKLKAVENDINGHSESDIEGQDRVKKLEQSFTSVSDENCEKLSTIYIASLCLKFI